MVLCTKLPILTLESLYPLRKSCKYSVNQQPPIAISLKIKYPMGQTQMGQIQMGQTQYRSLKLCDFGITKKHMSNALSKSDE